MSRVFLLEPIKSDMNLDAALAFGELVTMFPAGVTAPAGSDKFAEAVLDKIDELEFNPFADYFLVAGKLSRVTRAVGLLTNWLDDYGRDKSALSLLIYNDKAGAYAPAGV